MWVVAACASALFAGIVSIFVKCGVRTTDSDVATAIRTCVVLVFAGVMTFATGAIDGLASLSFECLLFLVLSGLATGASWLCYFKALSLGDVNKVVPIDKASVALTMLFAVLCLGETSNLGVTLLSILLILVGTFMMSITKSAPQEAAETQKGSRGWLFFAVLSAVFAALVAVLAKVGFQDVDSNLGTAIRTVVVLVLAWAIVIGKGKMRLVPHVRRGELGFIVASGIATGASWLCFFYAIQNGVVSVVVPIDKLSIVVSIAFSYFALHEPLSRRALAGLLLIVCGTVLVTVFS